jgi:signal transduction histidine kinase
LTNAVRHAAAQHIRLVLVTQPSEVQLTIEDDGRGFDTEQIPKDRYGLVGLNERTRLLGGTLDLQSSPGEGTRVVVTVKLS